MMSKDPNNKPNNDNVNSNNNENKGSDFIFGPDPGVTIDEYIEICEVYGKVYY